MQKPKSEGLGIELRGRALNSPLAPSRRPASKRNAEASTAITTLTLVLPSIVAFAVVATRCGQGAPFQQPTEGRPASMIVASLAHARLVSPRSIAYYVPSISCTCICEPIPLPAATVLKVEPRANNTGDGPFRCQERHISQRGKGWPHTRLCTIVTLANLTSDVFWHSTV